MIQRFFRALSVLSLLALPALAQFDSATVLGTIRDPQGLALRGAQVRLEALATNFKLTTSTTNRAISNFPPSAWANTASLPKPAASKPVNLSPSASP
jgi:hypothetical protein